MVIGIDALPQNVQCTIAATEPNTCYIATPIYLQPGFTLNIVDTGNLANITRFELRAFTNFITIPSTIWTSFPNLEELILANYSSVATLSATDFLQATKLKILNLRGNKLTTIPFSAFALAPALQAIDLSYNVITEIDDLAFNGLKELTALDLSNNRIGMLKAFTFSGLINLQILDLSNNKIKLVEDGALSLPQLVFLDVNSNDIKLLPENLFGIQSPPLTVLDFGDNKLSHIGASIYNLKELTLLNLTSNKKIDDINLAALADLPKLESLILTSSGFQFPTTFTDPMEIPDFTNLPVPTSTSPLKRLYLAKNKLINPDVLRQLAYFRQLEVLSLETNRFTFITDVDKLTEWFPNLRTIFIGENKLSCDWLNQTIPLFEQADVHVYTIQKVKTWSGNVYTKKIIDMNDCFDLGKIFDNIMFFISKFSKAF